MDEFATPIDQLRNKSELPAPIDTRGAVDASSSLDYNELLKNADHIQENNHVSNNEHQQPISEQIQHDEQQIQQHQMQQQMQQQQMQQQQMQQQQMQQQQQFQQNTYPNNSNTYPNNNNTYPNNTNIHQNNKQNNISSNLDVIQKDFVLVLICSLLIHSNITQSFFQKYIKFMFIDKEISTIGILSNAVILSILIVVVRNINLSVNM